MQSRAAASGSIAYTSQLVSKSAVLLLNESLCSFWSSELCSLCIDARSLMSWPPSEQGNGFTPLDAAVSTSAATTASSVPLQFLTKQPSFQLCVITASVQR